MKQLGAIRKRKPPQAMPVQASPVLPAQVFIVDFHHEPNATAAELQHILASSAAMTFRVTCLQGDGCRPDELIHRVTDQLTQVPPAILFIVSDETSVRGAVLALINAFDSLFRGSESPPVCIVVTSPCGTPEILELLNHGAADVWLTPLRPSAALARVLHRVERLRPEQEQAVQDLKRHLGLAQFVGESPALLRAIRQIPDVARTDVSVLILGATGTGKEICAKAIHNLSARSRKPFVALNCGSFPQELVENELFGHVTGAFTSANGSASGLIAQAQGGTLFFDEVDSLPLSIQPKLLRFLQDKQYRPLGSQKACSADVRIVAASNADLNTAIQAGTFRKDLYYRLAVAQIELPPLGERIGDLLLLVDHFLKNAARESGLPPKTLSPAAMQRLLLHSWPGNVRELENVIAAAAILSKKPLIQAAEIIIHSLTTLRPGVSFKTLKAEAIQAFEKVYLQQLLLAHDGNITLAAKAAGKHRSAFWQVLRKHDLLSEDREPSRHPSH
jgi:DNA-binding NtrC family response regulator